MEDTKRNRYIKTEIEGGRERERERGREREKQRYKEKVRSIATPSKIFAMGSSSLCTPASLLQVHDYIKCVVESKFLLKNRRKKD